MKKLLVVSFFIVYLLNIINAKENSVKYSPLKPHGGDEITITYNGEGTELAKTDKIEMTIYLCSSKSDNLMGIEEAHSILMDKNGNEWKAKVKTLSSTDFIALTFDNGEVNEHSENNEGKGYFIKFYDNTGKELEGSKLCYATCVGNWGPELLQVKGNVKEAFEIMNEIFLSKPELKAKSLLIYLLIINDALNNEDSEQLILQELNEAASREDLKDIDYTIMSHFYTRFKMNDKADEIKNLAVKKFPNGDCAFRYKYDELTAEKDLDKQLSLALQMVNDFKDLGYESNYAGLNIVFGNLINGNRTNALKEVLNKDNSLLNNQSVVTTLLENLLKADKEIEFAQTIAEKGVELFRKELAKPLSEKEAFYTEAQTLYNRKSSLGNILFMYGKILYMLNKNEEALKNFEEALSLIQIKFMQLDKFESYIKCLLANKKNEKAQQLIEEAVKNSRVNNNIKESLKEVFVQKNGSEKGFDEYLSKLENIGKSSILDALKKEMIKENAPKFSLKDLDGKNVSLTDFKGKTVIIDFWATWCGPCKASFPGMQKAVEKYAKDENVKFLFVDTWEQATDVTKNASDFIKQNKYTFHVLIDSKNEVVKSFGVQGVPSKFVIDKEGFIRFKKVGAPEGIDAIVEEVSAMIELAGQ
ncbi:MAG: redoxin domain-containing protein [Ignavibacteriales bacterium]|nr:redoxin domain-containing protein [Ignavibacteriales bacterium]